MLKKYIKISVLVTLATALISCSGTDPIGDPRPEPFEETNTLTLKFKSHFNGDAVDFNMNQFVTSSKDTITPSKFKFLMSDIRMVKMDDAETALEGKYGYVSFEESKTEVVLPAVQAGSFKAIRFNVGLDSSTNHGDPAVWAVNHPLNVVNNGLHWGWQGGYIFMAHEGSYLDNGANESYTFHIATLPFANTIEIPFSYIHSDGDDDVIEISVDLSKYFDGVHAFSLKNDISASHSAAVHAPYINKLRENIKLMFSAKKL